jgi:hypothetical protein
VISDCVVPFLVALITGVLIVLLVFSLSSLLRFGRFTDPMIRGGGFDGVEDDDCDSREDAGVEIVDSLLSGRTGVVEESPVERLTD